MKNNAFTLAEILITLVIIGVVAALTIPTLMNSTMDKEYIAATHRIERSVAEAARQMAVNDEIKRFKNVVDFVENDNGLQKRIDITRFCAPTGYGSKYGEGSPYDCGFAKTYQRADTTQSNVDFTNKVVRSAVGLTWKQDGQDFDGYAFQMSNGYAVLLFYNNKCKNQDINKYAAASRVGTVGVATCVSGIYDMNGRKAPNQMGKDMGTFAVVNPGMQAVGTAVLPEVGAGILRVELYKDAQQTCESNDLRIPTVEDVSAIAGGSRLILTNPAAAIWTSSSSTSLNNDLIYS